MRMFIKQIARLVNIGVMALIIAGCATTEQAPNVQMSGFLGDYSKFHRGKGGQAEYVYRDRNVDFIIQALFNPIGTVYLS